MMSILKRLSEPSTWAGLAVLVAIVSPSIAGDLPSLGEGVGQIVAGVLAILAVINKDPGSDE